MSFRFLGEHLRELDAVPGLAVIFRPEKRRGRRPCGRRVPLDVPPEGKDQPEVVDHQFTNLVW
jgi:hypothetical protein